MKTENIKMTEQDAQCGELVSDLPDNQLIEAPIERKSKLTPEEQEKYRKARQQRVDEFNIKLRNNLTPSKQVSVKTGITYKNALLRYVISDAIKDYFFILASFDQKSR